MCTDSYIERDLLVIGTVHWVNGFDFSGQALVTLPGVSTNAERSTSLCVDIQVGNVAGDSANRLCYCIEC